MVDNVYKFKIGSIIVGSFFFFCCLSTGVSLIKSCNTISMVSSCNRHFKRKLNLSVVLALNI